MEKRVLISEDDCAIRLLLERLLTRRGFVADSVATGAEAAARALREPYDLIILDLLMPEMSGYEVVERLRCERPNLLNRVIVVTAQQRTFQLPLPVAAIIRKPFDLDELDRVIDRVVLHSSRPPHEEAAAEYPLP